MILVVGATGMVGSEVCRLLAGTGRPVRAMVRRTADRAKVDALEQLGASVVQGDLRDPASLAAACEGVSTVVSTASAMPFAYLPEVNTPASTDQEGGLRLAAAAVAAHVPKFVYVSFPPMPTAFPLQDAKRAVEQRLRESALDHTILQPTFFMEAWLSPMVGFDYVQRKATLYGTGDNPISWISYRDVARFAAASIDNRAVANSTLLLGGPEAISPRDVVRIFEGLVGESFEEATVPVEALQAQAAAATDPMQKSFAGLMLAYASAEAIDMAATLRLFPLDLYTVSEYARRVLGVAAETR